MTENRTGQNARPATTTYHWVRLVTIDWEVTERIQEAP